jgi:hypothetical protein
MNFLSLGPFEDRLGVLPETVSPWRAEPADAPAVGLNLVIWEIPERYFATAW